MNRIVAFLFSGTLLFSSAAQAAQPPAGHPTPTNASGVESHQPAAGGTPATHGASQAQGRPTEGGTAGMIGVIQDSTLAAYPKMKIGEVVRRYHHLKKKEWFETRGARGVTYVDFIGTSRVGLFDFAARKEGISARGVEIKFVIHPNGQYGVGMVSRVLVMKDGNIVKFPLPDGNEVLKAIYEDRELQFH